MTRVTLYAAYGTNLDPARMGERCPHSPLRGTGWLQGWRLTFGGEDHGWDGALATMVQDPFEQVFVARLRRDRRGRGPLDQWESADTGLYRQDKVRVATLTGEVVAWMYVLDAFEGGLPSASYLGVLADAAEAAGAPADYVSWIRSRECRSTGLWQREPFGARDRTGRLECPGEHLPRPAHRRRRGRRGARREDRRRAARRGPGDGLAAGCRPSTRWARRPPRSAPRTCPASRRRPWPGTPGKIRSVRAGDRNLLVFLGRTHFYEGLGVRAVVHGVRTAAAAGCRTVVLTNGCGGLGRPGRPARRC